MADLFVSYKAEDRRRVARLVSALEAEGFSVWWDAHLDGGSEWREEIERNLDAAKCVIVVWSKRSTGSDGEFVRDEASRAMRRKAYLPVRIDRVDPPLGFGEQQTIDLTGWKGDVAGPRFQRLLAVARQRIGGGSHLPSVAKANHRSLDRRSMLAAGGAIVAATAVSAWLALKPTGARANSIAVMPFANLSSDPEQAYFSDGIAEELRSALARVPNLKVVARTSSEAVRDQDAKTAARKLGVGNILSGSVRRSASKLRISAQLVDGRDGTQRWSQTYDRTAGDSLAIQSDIARQVAAALQLTLIGTTAGFREIGETDDPAAQDLKLHAAALIAQSDDEATVRRALSLLEAAVARDPHYGKAHAARANLLLTIGSVYVGSAAESSGYFDKALSAAKRAIDLSPKSPDGYGVLGLIYQHRLKLRAAAEQFDKMLHAEGTPDTRILSEYAWTLADIARADEGLALSDQVIEVDPLNANTYFNKAMILKDVRRYDEAELLIEQAIRLAPARVWPRVQLGAIKLLKGDRERARAILEAVPPDQFIGLTWLAVLNAREGRRDEALRNLERLKQIGGDSGYVQYAGVYSQLGDRPAALLAVERAWQFKDPGLSSINVDSLYDPIRDEPRFRAIVAKVMSS